MLFVVLLTVIVAEYGYETQVDASLMDNQTAGLAAYVAAKSAVAVGMSLLVADLQQAQQPQQVEPCDSLQDVWAQPFPGEECNGALMYCSIDDEYGKLNLNALFDVNTGEVNGTLEMALRSLFAARGVEQDPVDAILDWVDPDQEPRSQGGEADFYGSLEIPYSCRDGRMESVEELLLIRGITPDVFFGRSEEGQLPLSELLTVCGSPRGRINLNTAEPEVLAAIGEAIGQTGLADVVVRERERAPFTSVADLEARGIIPRSQPTPTPTPAPGGAQPASRPQPRMFEVASRTFRIHGLGLIGESRARVEAFVRRGAIGSPELVRILDWRVIQ